MAGEPRVVAIVGPTAVGKTSLSLCLARAFDGEVISADSRQIYRGMDIGTAKAPPEEQAVAPHHLLDIADPDESLTLAQYKALADAAIRDIWSRGRLPLLVGGTGLYVRAVLEGWTVPEVPPNTALREALYGRAEQEGHEALHRELAAVDPDAAEAIDARNVRRVIRALEVYRETGVPISRLQERHPPDYRILRIGLTMSRPALYARIDARVDAMLAGGLVQEVRRLLEQGYTLDLPALSGLGYRQIAQHLAGEISLEEAVDLIKRHTRRFVRQQYNWFRLNDPDIHWLDAEDDPTKAAIELVRSFLAEP
jgi:tRNA dimethylallyltransferase